MLVRSPYFPGHSDVYERKKGRHGMTRSLAFRNILLTLSLLCLTRFSYGQGDTARLQGTITDPQNAAVAGASVTVTSTDTDRTISATTNDLGYYAVSALPAGHYRGAVTLKGMKK